MEQPIMGHEFSKRLIEAGFDLPEQTSRIVVDIPCNGCVEVYYETYASRGVLDVVIEALIANKDRIVVVKHKKKRK
jgi:hypothetical protein